MVSTTEATARIFSTLTLESVQLLSVTIEYTDTCVFRTLHLHFKETAVAQQQFGKKTPSAAPSTVLDHAQSPLTILSIRRGPNTNHTRWIGIMLQTLMKVCKHVSMHS